MPNSVSWNLQMNVRDGQLDKSRILMEEMVTSTKTESGAQTYHWYYSKDDKTCHINEQYGDSAAVMVHLGNFGSKFAERFMACFEPTALSVYGNPSEEARAALDTMGAAYLRLVGGFSR